MRLKVNKKTMSIISFFEHLTSHSHIELLA